MTMWSAMWDYAWELNDLECDVEFFDAVSYHAWELREELQELFLQQQQLFGVSPQRLMKFAMAQAWRSHLKMVEKLLRRKVKGSLKCEGGCTMMPWRALCGGGPGDGGGTPDADKTGEGDPSASEAATVGAIVQEDGEAGPPVGQVVPAETAPILE